MQILIVLTLALTLVTAAARVCDDPSQRPPKLRQDETHTLPRTADAAATGRPIRPADAAARLALNAPTEYVTLLAGAGQWILLLRHPRIGSHDTGAPELLLWNPETTERRAVARWDFDEDYREDIAGFDGRWVLVARRPHDRPLADLVIHDVTTGERRQIATFDPEAVIGGWPPYSGLSVLDGTVLLAETVRRGPGDEREQIRLFSIEKNRWETPVDLAHPPGENTLIGHPVLGDNRIAWRQAGEGGRPSAIVVLDWKAGRRVRFDQPVDFVALPIALSADGRYMVWGGGPPPTPTGPNTGVSSYTPPRLFATDLQTMDTVDIGQGNGPVGLLAMTTNTRFGAMPSWPLERDRTVWGITYDLHAREVRPVVGEPERGSDDVAIVGDWLVVGERGVTRPGDRHPADVETLYLFKLPP